MITEIPAEHFVGRVAQKAIIAQGNRILIVRDHIDEDTWDLPGGRIHKEEEPREGLAREIREEIGADVEVGAVVSVGQFIKTRDFTPHFFLAYECTLKNPDVDFALPSDEIAEAKWITPEQISEQKIYGICREAIEKYSQKRR